MAFVIDRNLDVDAPAAVVWEVITDLARYPEWNPFCLACASTLQPGDPIDMTVRLLARPQQQREWIQQYMDGEGFSYSMKPLPLGALSSWRAHRIVAREDDRCEYHSLFRLQGWLQGVVTTLLGARLRVGFTAMNAAVKQRAEQLWRVRKITTQA